MDNIGNTSGVLTADLFPTDIKPSSGTYLRLPCVTAVEEPQLIGKPLGAGSEWMERGMLTSHRRKMGRDIVAREGLTGDRKE